METIALRQFDPLYIWLDLIFLFVLAGLLLWKRKYATVLVGLLAGLLYMAVDYGIFHLLCHSRSITPGYSLFWVLLWMSMSYGFTNFTWIWLWLSRDRDLPEWTGLILLWWFCCPLLVQTFGGRAQPIVIQRTTGAYHGYMALLLLAGYLIVLIWNLAHREKRDKLPLLWMLSIGILVQFSWEALLLLGGIRSVGFDAAEQLRTLVLHALLETNLGMPYIFGIYLWFSSRFREDLSRRSPRLSCLDRLREYHTLPNPFRR